MKQLKAVALGISAVVLLEGCAAMPMGPTVQVMPAPNKPFEVFVADQTICKSYAEHQVSGQAEAANERAIGGTLIGSALGAGLGAALGGGRGAGVGAAAGGLMGTAVGGSNSQHAQGSIQEQYDNAYAQCMYAKGNQVAQPVQPQPPVVVVPGAAVVYPTAPAPYYAPPSVYSGSPPATGYAPPPAPGGYSQPPAGGYAPPPGAYSAPPPPPGTAAPPPPAPMASPSGGTAPGVPVPGVGVGQ